MDLYVRLSGPERGTPILFLHGGGLSGRMWEPVVECLPEYRCIVPDLPEHGQSAAITPLTMDATLEHVRALIAEHTPENRAHVVGLSMGGAIAVTLLAQSPERVDRVIASGTSRRMSRWLAAVNNLNAPMLRLLSPDQVAGLMMMQLNIPAQHRAMLRDEAALMTPGAVIRMSNILMEVDTPPEGSRLLLVVGQKETFVARRMARQYAAAVPGITVRTVQGVGHAWCLEQPALFAEMVRAWLDGAPLPAALA